MSEKPEALRLAHELDAYHNAPHHKLAAIELRRLHAENERLREALEKVLAADDDPNDKLTYLRSRTRVVIFDALRREPGDG